MRAISLVNRLEFDFVGNVVRNAITLGDVDNDNNNELIVGNDLGEVAIFKGKEKWRMISGLTFISCVAIGDILNQSKNFLVIITSDGWCYIYHCSADTEEVDGQIFSSKKKELDLASDNSLKRIHVQRIPANTKSILLGDIDGDGSIEMVLGLTDRVVRSYRWASDTFEATTSSGKETSGKLVGLNKWECANQIGSVTLHHSYDNTPYLLIAQPGGTFMRIRCQSEDTASQGSQTTETDSNSARSENLVTSSIDYQFLGLSRMRNQNISTEILGDLKMKYEGKSEGEISDKTSSKSSSTSGKSEGNVKTSIRSRPSPKGKPYAVATLDGTIMLVQDEIILWAIAVDHQVFALTKLDITGNDNDDLVVCSWDGQTYILDQNKNTVRFQLDESVQAFESGYYNLNVGKPAVTCFVYVTFRNKIYLYYDIPLKEMVLKKFDLKVDELEGLSEEIKNELKINTKSKKQFVEYLLYGIKDCKAGK